MENIQKPQFINRRFMVFFVLFIGTSYVLILHFCSWRYSELRLSKKKSLSRLWRPVKFRLCGFLQAEGRGGAKEAAGGQRAAGEGGTAGRGGEGEAGGGEGETGGGGETAEGAEMEGHAGSAGQRGPCEWNDLWCVLLLRRWCCSVFA